MKTKSGRTLTSARIVRFENDAAVISHSDGISKVRLLDIADTSHLPKDIQEAIQKVQSACRERAVSAQQTPTPEASAPQPAQKLGIGQQSQIHDELADKNSLFLPKNLPKSEEEEPLKITQQEKKEPKRLKLSELKDLDFRLNKSLLKPLPDEDIFLGFESVSIYNGDKSYDHDGISGVLPEENVSILITYEDFAEIDITISNTIHNALGKLGEMPSIPDYEKQQLSHEGARVIVPVSLPDGLAGLLGIIEKYRSWCKKSEDEHLVPGISKAIEDKYLFVTPNILRIHDVWMWPEDVDKLETCMSEIPSLKAATEEYVKTRVVEEVQRRADLRRKKEEAARADAALK